MGHESGHKLLLGTSYRWRKHHAWNQVESHAFKMEIVCETACFQARCKWDQEFYHWIINISYVICTKEGMKAASTEKWQFSFSFFLLFSYHSQSQCPKCATVRNSVISSSKIINSVAAVFASITTTRLWVIDVYIVIRGFCFSIELF